jgi:hypothetical protein
MTIETRTKCEITDGPSAGELLLKWGIKQEDGKRFSFSFRFIGDKGEVEIPIVINSLEWEDGSGENWNFRGYSPEYSYISISGFFNTKRRHGYMTFIKH